MLVWIVYAVTADRRGPNLERMNRVEDVDDDLGRLLVQTGEARQPTDDEVAAFQAAAKVEAKALDAAEHGGDLTGLTKTDLLTLAEQRGVDVPGSATKADIIAALEAQPATNADPAPADAST